LLRSYFERDEKETTLWFVWEGDFVIFLPERKEGTGRIENIQTLEESVLHEISYDVFKDLCEKYTAIDRFYSKFLEDSYLYFENRILTVQFYTAKERYFEIVKTHPEIVQRIPLNMLASYLGITKERLSRIRAEK
jgi:CRP-like cAMP-binding protein